MAQDNIIHNDPILFFNPAVKKRVDGNWFYELDEFPYVLENVSAPVPKNPLKTPRNALGAINPKEGLELDLSVEKMMAFLSKLGYKELVALKGLESITYGRKGQPRKSYRPILSCYDTHTRGNKHKAKYLLISSDNSSTVFHADTEYARLLRLQSK